MSTLSAEALIIHSIGKDGYEVVHVRRAYDQWPKTVLEAEKALMDSTPLFRVEIWMNYYEEGILVWEGESK